MKTILNIISGIFSDPMTSIWVGVVALFVLGLGYLGVKLTRGFISGYLKANIGDNLKIAFVTIQGLGSLILALMLPNNYLVEIEFFRGLYEQSGLWIATSIVILLFTFIVLFGTLFTLLTKNKVKNIEDVKK